MSIRKADSVQKKPSTTSSEPEQGTLDAKKKKGKSLLLKIGIGAAGAAAFAATGGTAAVAGIAAKLGPKVLPHVAGAMTKIAGHIPGKLGGFVSSKAGTLATAGGTATAGSALAAGLGGLKGAGVAKDVKEVVDA